MRGMSEKMISAAEATAVSSSPGGAGAILTLIREGRATTRAELIKLTGLARSTVAQRVDGLVANRLVIASGAGASTGGRRPTLLRFNADAGVVLAADLGATHGRLAVTNLAGKMLVEIAEDVAIAAGPKPVLEWLQHRFVELLKEAGRSSDLVRAIGVGVPGPVEFASGKPVNPPIMPGWHGFPLAASLRERFRVPVLVDNDVNMMALGEHSGHLREVADLVFVKVGTGIGMGIVVNGAIYRGSIGSAGDVGHVQLQNHDDVVCNCGNHGCLEAIAGGGALAAALTELGVHTSNARGVVDQVRAGNPEALRLVRQAGREIGSVLAAVINVLNPAVLVIGGDLAEAGELLLAGLREVIYQRSTALATHSLQISLSATGDRAGVLGAGWMAIEHILSPRAVDQALLAQVA